MEELILKLIKYVEKYSPLLFFILSFLMCVLYFDTEGLKKFILNTNDSFLSIFITLAGFLLTIYTIIQSIENRVIRVLKESNNYSRLIRYLNQAVKSDFLVVLLIIGVLFFKYNDDSFFSDSVSEILISFYVSYLVFTIVINIRIIYFIGTIFPYNDRS